VKVLATMGLAISSTIAINLHLLISILWLHRFGTKLTPGRYLRVIGMTYLMALVAYAIYYLTGIGGIIEARVGMVDFWSALLAGTLKAGAVLVPYGIQAALYLGWRRRRGQ
jgi:hypothetical protein